MIEKLIDWRNFMRFSTDPNVDMTDMKDKIITKGLDKINELVDAVNALTTLEKPHDE